MNQCWTLFRHACSSVSFITAMVCSWLMFGCGASTCTKPQNTGFGWVLFWPVWFFSYHLLLFQLLPQQRNQLWTVFQCSSNSELTDLPQSNHHHLLLSWAFCTELCKTLQFCSDSAGFLVELHFLQKIFIERTICLPGQMFCTCSANVCAHANFDTMKTIDKPTNWWW